MKIAICDDDLTELNRITAFLDEYSKTNRLPLTCKTFCSSIELASTAMQESYDLYLLDILMPALNGIELAREIRNFDRAADLIFLTSSPEYAVDSYTVKASDYLLKPVQKKRFFAALDDILEQKERLLEKSIFFKIVSRKTKRRRLSLIFRKSALGLRTRRSPAIAATILST